MKSPIILALDTTDVDEARSWISATNSAIHTYKAGLEFFLTHGAEGIKKLREAGEFDLFLDLKLHDIPNTVAAAVRTVAPIAPKFLTVHATGGSEMISGAATAAPDIDITAVTVLTSFSEEGLREVGFPLSALETAKNMARMSVQAGAKAIVSSPHEVAAIRDVVGSVPTIITPGVRPAGSALGDQKRVMTPADAIAAGATYLVIGRPITSLKTPEAMIAMANEILESI